METLHLVTQRNQPYGSVRRCCENCGAMVDGKIIFTDDEKYYETGANGLYKRCDGFKNKRNLSRNNALLEIMQLFNEKGLKIEMLKHPIMIVGGKSINDMLDEDPEAAVDLTKRIISTMDEMKEYLEKYKK